jgi:hypothetical protein
MIGITIPGSVITWRRGNNTWCLAREYGGWSVNESNDFSPSKRLWMRVVHLAYANPSTERFDVWTVGAVARSGRKLSVVAAHYWSCS